MLRRLALSIVIGLALACSLASWAAAQVADYQPAPFNDWKHHAFVVTNAGWLGYKNFASGGSTWNGVDLALGAGYNDGPFTLVSLFDHGFAVGRSDGQANSVRLYGNMKLYPSGPGGPWQAFAGLGWIWLGQTTIREWHGPEVHITGTRTLTDRLALAGYYGHAFGTGGDERDFDFYRLFLTGRIWP